MSKKRNSAKKPHGLYATLEGGSDTVWVWLGKPTAYEEDCDKCGQKRDSWISGRGSRALLEDICAEGFAKAGITFPARGGIVKFKVVVED